MLIHMLATVHGRQAHDRVGIDQSCAHQDNPCASCSESARDTPRVWGSYREDYGSGVRKMHSECLLSLLWCSWL
jgi:hypothetical protein